MLTDAMVEEDTLLAMPQQQRCPFVQVPQLLLPLPHGEYKTYCVLIAYTNYRQNGNRCWPSLAAIAREAGLGSADQVRRYIRKLEERHAVRVVYRGDTSNLYYLRYLVVNGGVVDAGSAIPALDATQLRTLIDARAASSRDERASPATGAHASTQEVRCSVQAHSSVPRPSICQGGLADPAGGEGRIATPGSQFCGANQTKEPEQEKQNQEQQQAPVCAAASKQDRLDGTAQELLTRLTGLGMLEPEARKLLRTADPGLVEQTLTEATENSSIQNPAGWILQVVRYRERDITYRQRSETSGRAGKYLPNLASNASSVRQAAQEHSEMDRANELFVGDDHAARDNHSQSHEAQSSERDDSRSRHADCNDRHTPSPVWTEPPSTDPHPTVSIPLHRPVAPAEEYAGCTSTILTPANQDSSADVRRQALPVLLRWEKSHVIFPPLPPELRLAGEQALRRLGQQARQALAMQRQLDSFEQRVLAWAEHNAGRAVA